MTRYYLRPYSKSNLETFASIHHDRADRLAFVHQVEGRVDLLERHGVGDEIVDVDLPLHVPVDDLRHVRATARAAEGGALQTRPVTSWNGRVAISWPDSATPMMIDSPQPRWQHSSAWRMVRTLPMHSNEKSAPPPVRSTIASTTLSWPTSSG